jgi:hypothetical protein
MKIIETTIPDVTEENLDEKKVKLADTVLSSFEPLLAEMHVKKSEEEKNLTSQIEANKERISQEKVEIQTLLNEYEKEKKIRKTLEAVSNVDPVKLEYNRSLKSEIVVFLRIMEKLSLEKVSSYLQDIIKISNKTVSKSLIQEGGNKL